MCFEQKKRRKCLNANLIRKHVDMLINVNISVKSVVRLKKIIAGILANVFEKRVTI